MNEKFRNIALKAAKISGIVIVSILLLLYLIPLLFPGTVASEVKKIANERLNSKMDFSKSRFSFFTHFPSLTVSLDDLTLTGSAPFTNDTLLKAEQVAFGINIKRLLFNNEVKINKLFVSKALVNVMVNQKGEANYNIYIAPKDNKNTSEEIVIRRHLDQLSQELEFAMMNQADQQQDKYQVQLFYDLKPWWHPGGQKWLPEQGQ